MAHLVLGVGGFMVLAGLIALVVGIDMLPTERGVAAVIASVTALSAGVIAMALGVAIQRLDWLIGRIDGLGRSVRPAAPKDQMAGEPVAAPPAPSAPPVAPAAQPADPVRSEPAAGGVPAMPPVAPVERPKFQLPSFNLGRQTTATAAGAMAGVAAGAAVASQRTAVEAEAAVEAAIADLRKDAAAAPPAALAEPAEPPVEVLTPVDEPETPAAAPPSDDPLQAFEAELDKLIPLKSGRKAKVRKDKADAAEGPRAPEPAGDRPEPPEPAVMPEAPPAPVALAEEAPAKTAEPDSPARPSRPIFAPVVEDDPFLPAPEAPREGAEIVGAYESGGAKYTMFSDGSVIAEADGQKLFFRTLDDLRAFIDGALRDGG